MSAIVFLYRNMVIGRKILPLRVCTCPKRDMETEEKQEKKNISTVQQGLRDDGQPGEGKVKMEKVGSDQKCWVWVSFNFNVVLLSDTHR